MTASPPAQSRSAGDDVFSRFLAMVEGTGEKARAELVELAKPLLSRPWLPQPGPQTEAFLSEADLLLYGGAAGGGKTDLGIGLALTEHESSVIFRRLFKDLRGIEDRLVQIAGIDNWNKGDKIYRDGKTVIELGHLEAPGAELSWQGRPHDLIYFDEGAQLSAAKVNFVMGWNRSATGHRCRTVIGSNPPLGGEGDWLLEWFAPWLDPLFKNPAKPGELRWAVVLGDGDEIRSHWVDEAELQTDDAGRRFVVIDGQVRYALSRTFIPSLLDDNRYLRDTNYRASIDSMPEPIRSALLFGSFTAARRDHEWQVIPTAWVHAAQERWRENAGKRLPAMLSLGVDVAQGGADKTVLAALHGKRFAELLIKPGEETPDGPGVAALILATRRNDAGVTIDLTGGWGGSARDHLRTHHRFNAFAFVASAKSGARSKDKKFAFFNKRAESWWKFREALDPESGENVELPPDPRLLAELTAPRWELRGDKVLVESKDDLRDRLGSSTDRADAVLMAWLNRTLSELRKTQNAGGSDPFAPVPLADPLAGW